MARSTAYYKPVPVSESDLALMAVMDRIHLERPYAGSRMMRDLLLRSGFAGVGRRRVITLMRKMGIQAVYRKPNTSKRHPGHKIYPYLLRTLPIVRPNQVWALDITYLPMKRGFLYLCAVIDWFSRKVLSWRLSNTMHADFCVEAVQEAIIKYGKPEIVNTDQGSQFTSLEFTEMTLTPSYHGLALGSGGGGGVSSMKAYNRLGERFMQKYDPRGEKAPRHIVVRAIHSEKTLGNNPFHCEEAGKITRRGIHSVYRRKRLAGGLDWLKHEFDWEIALHRLLGGARIDENAATRLPGLFAAGEASGGVHGAGRLPGMALAENNVMGARAGYGAAKYARESSNGRDAMAKVQVEALRSLVSVKGGVATPMEVTRRVQEAMWRGVGVFRDEAGLSRAVEELAAIEAGCLKEVDGTPIERLEIRNLARAGRLVALAALNRRESRANHYRRDYSEHAQGAAQHVIVFKGPKGPEVTMEPVRN